MAKSCIYILNAFLKWWEEEYGEDGNGDNGNGEEQPPKPIQWFGASPQEVFKDIKGLKAPMMRDSWYWAADANTCIEWIREAHATAPKYKPITKNQRGWDCDKAAHRLVSFFYERCHTRIWEVWGNTPQGPHAWNVFDNECGRFEVEPQTADVWEIGTNPQYEIWFYIAPKPDN